MDNPTTPQRTRRNSLITLMCEMEGIDPPGEDAYTIQPASPLTAREINLIERIIEERNGNEIITVITGMFSRI